MRRILLLSGLAMTLVPLRAGSVVTLADSPVAEGKLTLKPSSIHVEGASPTDIKLSDILEAGFSDAPFQLDYFSSNSTPNHLPATWKGMTVGQPDIPGSFTYSDGSFTLSGSAGTLGSRNDTVFFVGQPWNGDGEWTARLRETDGQNQTEGGLLLRENLDSAAPSASVGMTALEPPEGWTCFRARPGDSASIRGFGLELPVWFRLTRNGNSFLISTSGDGKQWGGIYQGFGQMASSTLAGIFISSNLGKTLRKVVIDQVSFTPRPCAAQVLPSGVLLRSGSFIAGAFNPLNFDPDNPDAPGNFTRNEKNVVIPRSKIAAVTLSSTARSELANVGTKVGLIMRNGDFLAGDPEAINGGGVRISSLLLGLLSYDRAAVRACTLLPVQPQAAAYEIRLTDGSIIRASGLNMNDGQLVVHEISGITVEVAAEEIVQFRAGPAQVQSLLDLPWKTTPPSSTSGAPPATNVASGTNAPPVTTPVPPPHAGPSANTVQDTLTPCWTGPHQEQIMMAPAGTTVDFPLTEKFRAVALRIALSPDMPPNAEATLRILADGREIGHTPPCRTGDQPRFVEIALKNPRTVTLVADSFFAGTKVLFIDPVAIRENAIAPP